MHKRKPMKFVSILLSLCLLLIAFSGSAIQAQADETGMYISEEVSATRNVDRWALVNLYDEATFSDKKDYIDIAIGFADTIYSDLFSVSMSKSRNTVVDTVTNLADCPAGTDLPCREAMGCGGVLSHHKDIGCVMDDLFDWYLSEEVEEFSYDATIVILWTSYEGVYCEYINGRHTYPAYCAVSQSTESTTTIMDPMAWTASGCTAHMSFLLAHEMAHHMGCSDVYNTGSHIDNSEYVCLMDYFDAPALTSAQAYEIYQDWLENPENAFCDDCELRMGV